MLMRGDPFVIHTAGVENKLIWSYAQTYIYLKPSKTPCLRYLLPGHYLLRKISERTLNGAMHDLNDKIRSLTFEIRPIT